MWFLIHQINPVWHFDASGSFLTRVKNQSLPLLYSIVVHDTKNKNILPIAEFFTTAHDGNNIGSYLSKIKHILELNNLSVSPLVVVDFSRPLINAILDVFNNSSIDEYLKWAYEFIVRKNHYIFGLMKTKLFLCSTHILKNIIKDYAKIEKKFKYSKTKKYNIKITFIQAFTLLQNSLSLNQFVKNLREIYFIFNSKELNFLVRESLLSLKKKSAEKRYNLEKKIFDILNDKKKRKNIAKKQLENTIIFKSKKQPSPFKFFFSKKINLFSQTISINSSKPTVFSSFNVRSKLSNPYFCPSLFKIINNKLDLVPLWTGILIHETLKDQTSRVNNNPIENYFNNMRNHILGISKKLHYKSRLFPSEMLSLSFKWLNAKYKEFYEKTYSEVEKLGSKVVQETLEKWSCKQQRCKNNKSYYDSCNQVGKLGKFFSY